MSKVTTKKSVYLRVNCCTECDWFQQPTPFNRDICPQCGSELEEAVGRYQYTTRESLFGSTTFYDNFTKKQ